MVTAPHLMQVPTVPTLDLGRSANAKIVLWNPSVDKRLLAHLSQKLTVFCRYDIVYCIGNSRDT